MTIHRSLAPKNRGRHRNVLKRYEKIKYFKEKGEWDEENPKYYGLPKVKCIKVKIKKVKAEKPEEAEAAATAEGALPATPEEKGKEEKKG